MPDNINTSKLELGVTANYENDATRETAIKIDHVSMTFNMASEQLDNLKEYFLKLVKHELFFEELTALDDISFEVKKGDVYGIVGTNGSGKSTLLKIIAGVLEPSSGSVELNGSIAPLIELGAGFDSELSARENIYLNGALLGYSHDFIDEHFDAIVEFAEVEKFLDMPLKNYSSGMVSRIAFAIATVIVPEILIVDEVLSVGDFMFQKKCENRITELIEQHGVTVLIVSHNNEQVARLCNKAIWIEKGHMRLKGDADIVTKIYGALAGRTGNQEAEQKIFQAVVSSINSANETAFSVVDGDTSVALNLNLAKEVWEQSDTNTIALACDTTHVNALLANSIAGALNCPVLSSKTDELPDVLKYALDDKKPGKIVLVDLANRAFGAKEMLKQLPWSPKVDNLGISGGVFNYSLEIFRYGIDHNWWSDTIVIVHFDAYAESLSLGPYLYLTKTPVIVLDEWQTPERYQKLVDTLKESNIKRVLILDACMQDDVELILSEIPMIIEHLPNEGGKGGCLQLTEFVEETMTMIDRQPSRILAASQVLSQWPDLISSGYYCAASNTPLLLINSGDLEELSESLDMLENWNGPLSLSFIGGKTGLDRFERSLLSTATHE